MDLNLKGKRAIVTGGSRGIGKTILETLAKEGASVATCARGQERLDATLAELREYGIPAFGEAVDVTDADAFSAWFHRAVDDLGGLDIFVSNCSTRVKASGEERWQQTFEYDLLQHIRATELAVPYLEKGNDPAIAMISSIAYAMSAPPEEERAYAAMKAALVSYGSQMSILHGQKGIRVNIVSPGPIFAEGGTWDQIRQHMPDMYERAKNLATLKRLGSTQEVANAITFLVSPAASFITGANLRVDGGMLKNVNY
jgi:NAD(P)-dependent dehydrogenase (short-subunit alcohol dehydrogenase family)